MGNTVRIEKQQQHQQQQQQQQTLRDNTTDDDEDEEEEERPHGRLTGIHVRDLANVPRGQVLVEGGGTVKH